MSKWIDIVDKGPSPSGKTRGWWVMPKDGGNRIGCIYWYGPWRKYVFMPDPNCVFEQDCLRDIADFIQAETTKHKAK